MGSDKRRRAESTGRRAERLAAWILRLKGYRIHAMRAATPVGEIDIICERRGILVFVEVKARQTVDAAIGAVTPNAWRRISNAAEYWAARNPKWGHRGWRYDIIAVAPGRWPRHLRDAWRPGLA